MIYDCFLYNGEIELLKIRMAELKDLDVIHILVQDTHTFSGQLKNAELLRRKYPYPTPDNLLVITSQAEPSINPWDNEKRLRNSIKEILFSISLLLNDKPLNDDIIIISDVDEIPRASAIKDWQGKEYAALIQDKFGFWLNCEEEHQGWHRSRIMRWSYLKDKSPEEIRHSGIPERIENAGWHWSWLGGIDEVMRKFKSFSHQEADVQKHAVREEIERKIKVGESLWGNDPWRIIPISSDFPQYIQDHQHDSLKHLIWK